MIDNTMLQRMAAKPAAEEPNVVIEAEPVEESLTFLRLLTYPLCGPGLTVMGMYVLLPFFLWMLVMLMPGPLKLAGGFVLMIVNILVTLSTLWYLTVCINASAEGRIKAPDVFEYSQDDTFWDWLRTFFLLAVTVSLCIAPAFLITHFAQLSAPAFWGILAAGIFFLPMLLLAVVMFDTINALNPILIIASIFSTFLSYLGIVVLFCVPLTLLIGMNIASYKSHDPLLSLLVDAVGLYLMMIAACLLGRFFYNNEEKLRWDV